MSNLKELDTKDFDNKQLLYIYLESVTAILENVDHSFIARKNKDGEDTYWLELGTSKLDTLEGTGDATEKDE